MALFDQIYLQYYHKILQLLRGVLNMNNVYLSKSKYCKCVQCKKILWLKKYKPECAVQTAKDAVLENGTKVGNLAKGLFGKYEDVEFDENLNVMIEKTKKLLQFKPNIITEASFCYENNFCSVDILKNDTDGVEIYEVKSSTEVHNIYLDDVSYRLYKQSIHKRRKIRNRQVI